MKFKVTKKDRTVTRNVKFYVKDENDKRIPNDLSVTYKYLTVSEFKELWAKVQPELDADGVPVEEDIDRITDIMETVIVNIEGAIDDDNNDIPYDRDLLDAVFDDMSARPAVMDGFVMIHTDNGRKAAKVKN